MVQFVATILGNSRNRLDVTMCLSNLRVLCLLQCTVRLLFHSFYKSSLANLSSFYSTHSFWIYSNNKQVNKDIEFIISHRLKANERVAMLHHILIEHNELCLKVSEYNKFWARYLMGTYFLLVSIICFTAFQAFFTSNLVIIRLIMFIAASLAAYIITKLSISAAIMSNLVIIPLFYQVIIQCFLNCRPMHHTIGW